MANFIGKCVRLSHNNNSKGLATNNVSRETIGTVIIAVFHVKQLLFISYIYIGKNTIVSIYIGEKYSFFWLPLEFLVILYISIVSIFYIYIGIFLLFSFPAPKLLIDIVGYIWYNMIVMLSKELLSAMAAFSLITNR